MATIVALSAAMTGCSGRRSLMPKAGGRPYEVVVTGDTDSIVYNTLCSPTPAMPQTEPMFDVRCIGDNALQGAMALARSIVVVSVDPKQYTRTAVKYERDAYAKGQIIVYVNSPSAQRLRHDMDGSDVVSKLIAAHELEVATAQLKNKHNQKMEDRVQRMFGINMSIPADMTACREGKGFVWMSNNSPTAMVNFCIYTSPNRDSVMRANIKGETDSMWMTTAHTPKPIRYTATDGSMWTRGLWEMHGDAMGGPFVSRAIHGRGGHSTVVVEAFVYAPGMRKRNLVMQAEAALHTATTATTANSTHLTHKNTHNTK